MTKISKKTAYPIKNPVIGDFFVGTDSENNNKTVSFGFEYAANLINRINGSLIINYMFKTDVNIPLAVLTEGHFLSQDNNTDINTVTKLYVNKTNFQEDDLSDLFLFIKENTGDYYFKLQNSENLINAVYFKINSIVAYAEYFEFNIEIDKTNPSLTTLVDSKVYFFSFEIKSNTTKTSDLENDGADGIHPFITAEDLPEPIDISGKENKSDKGQADGYVPLNALVKIASTYLDIVNDLVTGGANSLLSAEQGKQLQLQVSAINSILFSDNVNLDTVQEIVDAIESLQGYLDTILVNDLVTGGVTKALTAEMGKTLKGLIDALTTIVSDLQADVTNIDDRVTVLENFTPPPTTGLTGQAYAVWSGIGLKYYGTWPGYYIEGVFKSAGNGEITLNPTTSMTAGQKRYDLIILDVNGLNKITGVPDENPVLPTIDPDTQIIITNILLNAGDEEPSDQTSNREQIFDENTEWTVSKVGACTINANYAVNPYKGTKSLLVNAFGSGNEAVKFTASSTKDLLTYTHVCFRIKLLNFTNKDELKLRFEDNLGFVTSQVVVKRGLYNFTDNSSAYQLVVIPLSDFTIYRTDFTIFSIYKNSGNDRDFQLDDVFLAKSGTSTVNKQKAITSIVTNEGVANADSPDDTFTLKGIGNVEVSADGKDISISIDESNLVHKTGDETIDGNKTFLQPVSGEAATNPEHLVTKAQMDSAISTETTRATTAENTLQDNIDAEETARIAADADVLQEAKDYTDTGLALKLDAADYNDRYKGKYTSLGALETAHPTANPGDYAQVDAGAGSDVVNYNWDAEEGWVIGSSSGSGATNTDALPEGSTNLYFTTARAIAAVDISGKEDIANKSDSYTVSSSTTYASTKALVDGLATKLNGTTTPTATAFTHYFGETASDGIIRPKTLADTRTEIVTTAAVDAAKPNIVTGTGTVNYLPKFTGSGTVGNSSLYEQGGNISTNLPLTVSGSLFIGLKGNAGTLSTAIGNSAFSHLNSGFGSVALGTNAGTNYSSPLTYSYYSTYIGDSANSDLASSSYELVVGGGAKGLGNNTSVFGSSNTSYGRWWGNLLVGTSTNNGNAGRFAGTVDVNKLQINNTPATATGTSPLLTWNSTTKEVESVPYATFAPTASPTFTGTPTAPTAPAGTNTTQVATTAFVLANVGTGSTTNLALGTTTATTQPITNSNGTGFTLSSATTSLAGLLSSSDKTKLDGLVTNATHTGDVTGATVLTIANSAVTLGKMANVATGTIFYRKTAGTGVPEVQTLATLKTDLAITKSDIGLGNVDNTSDVNKPVSTAQQTALDLKANLESPAFTGTPIAPTAPAGTNTTQIATTAFVQSAAVDISGKEDIANKSDSYTVSSSTTYASTKALVDGLATKLNGTTTPTATAFSHYFGETASDGIIRPKTLANVRTEIVTTAAVNAAKPNIVTGTGSTNSLPKFTGASTIGNSNLSDNGTIITAYTDLSVNGLRIGRGVGNISTNVALGNNALTSITTSDYNVAIGQNALQFQSNGGSNMAIGGNSMQDATGGIGNSALGVGALKGLTVGNSNVSLGNSSMFFAGTSTDNTAVGATALYRLVNSNGNTAIGFDAGRYITGGGNLVTSTNSIFIGKGSKAGADSQDNQIVVGYNSDGLGSNTSVFGNSSTSFGRWWGNLLVGTSTNNGNAGRFAGTVDVNKLQINNTPATATGTSPLLTWNSTTKEVESVPYATFAPTASPTFTGIPTAPTAPAGTNTTQVATTAFVQNVARPYKVYTALIYQTGTNAPVATVLENTLGGTVVWTRNAVGQYLGTLSGVFTDLKTVCFTGGNTNNENIHHTTQRNTSSQVVIESYFSGAKTDSILNNTSIEIRVYN